MLVGLIVFYRRGSTEQLMLGLVICLCSVAAYSHVKPFEDAPTNVLAVLCQAQVFIVLLSAVVLRYSDVSAAGDSTDEQSESDAEGDIGAILVVVDVNCSAVRVELKRVRGRQAQVDFAAA